MLETAASRTALGAAADRAAHQILDKPLVFADPLAVRILGEAGTEALERRLKPEEAQAWRRLRAFIAARSRFAEEVLAEAVEGGTSQFVVLGAGLDTFACRNPHPRLAVFEVDHPATQAFKRAQLAAAGIEAPPSLAFVAIDFARQSLGTALAAAGFRRDEPAVFSWLGVTMYLDRAPVLARLAEIAAGAAPGTTVVFDYVVPAAALADPALRARYEALAERVAAIGEPWLSHFEPRELGETLRRSGYARVEDQDAAALNARYFASRADGLAVGPAAHLVAARV